MKSYYIISYLVLINNIGSGGGTTLMENDTPLSLQKIRERLKENRKSNNPDEKGMEIVILYLDKLSKEFYDELRKKVDVS